MVLSQVVDGPPEQSEIWEEAEDYFELIGWWLEDALHYEVFDYWLVEIDALPLWIQVKQVDGGLGFAFFLQGHLVELLGLEEVDFYGGLGGGAAITKVRNAFGSTRAGCSAGTPSGGSARGISSSSRSLASSHTIWWSRSKVIDKSQVKQGLSSQFRVIAILFNIFVNMCRFREGLFIQWLEAVIIEVSKFQHGFVLGIRMVSTLFEIIECQPFINIKRQLMLFIVGNISCQIWISRIENGIFV